jgi:hypothetical protein
MDALEQQRERAWSQLILAEALREFMAAHAQAMRVGIVYPDITRTALNALLALRIHAGEEKPHAWAKRIRR